MLANVVRLRAGHVRGENSPGSRYVVKELIITTPCSLEKKKKINRLLILNKIHTDFLLEQTRIDLLMFLSYVSSVRSP